MSQMQNRQVSNFTILSRVTSNLTAMNPRQIAHQAMLGRKSTNNAIQHYFYNSIEILYNQAYYTYNYTSTKGNINPRELAGVTMRGRE